MQALFKICHCSLSLLSVNNGDVLKQWIRQAAEARNKAALVVPVFVPAGEDSGDSMLPFLDLLPAIETDKERFLLIRAANGCTFPVKPDVDINKIVLVPVFRLDISAGVPAFKIYA